jgi:hypothetical protein
MHYFGLMHRTIVLFTRDLRVHDHPALHTAAAAGEIVRTRRAGRALSDRAFVRDLPPLEAIEDRSARGRGGLAGVVTSAL